MKFVLTGSCHVWWVLGLSCLVGCGIQADVPDEQQGSAIQDPDRLPHPNSLALVYFVEPLDGELQPRFGASGFVPNRHSKAIITNHHVAIMLASKPVDLTIKREYLVFAFGGVDRSDKKHLWFSRIEIERDEDGKLRSPALHLFPKEYYQDPRRKIDNEDHPDVALIEMPKSLADYGMPYLEDLRFAAQPLAVDSLVQVDGAKSGGQIAMFDQEASHSIASRMVRVDAISAGCMHANTFAIKGYFYFGGFVIDRGDSGGMQYIRQGRQTIVYGINARLADTSISVEETHIAIEPSIAPNLPAHEIQQMRSSFLNRRAGCMGSLLYRALAYEPDPRLLNSSKSMWNWLWQENETFIRSHVSTRLDRAYGVPVSAPGVYPIERIGLVNWIEDKLSQIDHR